MVGHAGGFFQIFIFNQHAHVIGQQRFIIGVLGEQVVKPIFRLRMLTQMELRCVKPRQRIGRGDFLLNRNLYYLIIFLQRTGLVSLTAQQLGFVEMGLCRIGVGGGGGSTEITVERLIGLGVFAFTEIKRGKLVERLGVVWIKLDHPFEACQRRLAIAVGLSGGGVIHHGGHVGGLGYPAAHGSVVVLAATRIGQNAEIFFAKRWIIKRIGRGADILQHAVIIGTIGNQLAPFWLVIGIGRGGALLQPSQLIARQLAAPHIHQVFHLLRIGAFISG